MCATASRRLTADDDGAAGVGVTETTTDLRDYRHPNNAMLKFWDLPGVGTPRFPKHDYLEAIQVSTNIILIVVIFRNKRKT